MKPPKTKEVSNLSKISTCLKKINITRCQLITHNTLLLYNIIYIDIFLQLFDKSITYERRLLAVFKFLKYFIQRKNILLISL